MCIRFINLTTKIPINGVIELEFAKTIDATYKKSVKPSRHGDYVDIFFVDECDPDFKQSGGQLDGESVDEERGMDIFGVYISMHPEFHRPIIKVSPEKIMTACVSFKKNNPAALPLARLYPTLLIAVVIHELAHWIMDDGENYSPDHDVYPWDWLVDRLEDDFAYPFHRTNVCKSSGSALQLNWKNQRHFVEESLANAFVLKQKVQGLELDFLKAFICSQPNGYKQGGLWSGNLRSTLKTANTWASFKQNMGRRYWSFLFDTIDHPLAACVNILKSNQSVNSVDFEREFQRYVYEHINAWQNEFKNAPLEWDERLNSTFGVYWWLNSWARCSYTQKHMKYIEQWSNNGSPEGFDEYYSALAKIAVADG